MSITPGPWEANFNIDNDFYRIFQAGANSLVFLGCVSDNGETGRANARAIAEVPNFIGLLADLVAGEDVEPIKREARTLLRRIEGEGGEGVAKTQHITVRFEPEDMERFKALAEKECRSLSNLITWAVLQYTGKKGLDAEAN